jgi:RNA polymerase sigma-70 factor (ECF subfamily)
MSNSSTTDELILHKRVLQNDPVAPVEVFKHYMDRLVDILGREASCNEDMAYDSAVDAVLAYLEEPGRYDPSKGRLVTYLIRVAKRRLLDRRRSATAQTRREQDFACSVELQARNPKEELEDTVDARFLLERLVDSGHLKIERDMRALKLILEDVRSTELLSEALGLGPLPKDEMQRKVKRHRDRLMKLLERFGRKEDSDDES